MARAASQVKKGEELAVLARSEDLSFGKRLKEIWSFAKNSEKAILITGIAHWLPVDDVVMGALFPPSLAMPVADEAIGSVLYVGTALMVVGRYLALPRAPRSRTGTARAKLDPRASRGPHPAEVK